MIVIGDSVTSLGARNGVSLMPQTCNAALIRNSRHTTMMFDLEIGVRIQDDVYYAPFCINSKTNPFDFCDEKLRICGTEYKFVIEKYGVILKLEVLSSFKPQDEDFCNVPSIFFKIDVENIYGNFRWCERLAQVVSGEVFVKFDKNFFKIGSENNTLFLAYDMLVENKKDFASQISINKTEQKDLIELYNGKFNNISGEIVAEFSLSRGARLRAIDFSWNSYLDDVFEIDNKKCSLKYKQRFNNINEVAKYSRQNYNKILKNADEMDKAFLGSDFGVSFDKLLCVSLHSFLMNTFLLDNCGKTVFSVWEGNCYFNSTIDVEFTQSQFYLALFPNLLKYQLDLWQNYTKKTKEGNIFLSHDVGELAKIDFQHYPHDMPLEESANYIILLYLYYNATNDKETLKNHYGLIKELVKFLKSCNKDNGVLPCRYTANTLDDASSAMQYGKEQVYLGVKIANAFLCAFYIGKAMNEQNDGKQMAKKIIKEIELKGFDKHYFVALSDDSEGVIDVWSNRPLDGKIPGTNAAHIYTFNTFAILSYAKIPTLLKRKRAKADLKNALDLTMQTYGSRHTSYLSELDVTMAAGLAGNSPKSGWLSMNMLRDIAAFRLDLDFSRNVERYWEWIETANKDKFVMFMETFAGNNLHFYPRGISLFGYFSAKRKAYFKKGKLYFNKKCNGNYPIIELINREV